MHDEEDDDLERSAISDNEANKGQKLSKKVPYPKDYSLVPYKKVSVFEERAIIEIEKIKKKNEIKIQKKRIEEKRKKIQEMKSKKSLAKQINLRKIEQNIKPNVK